MTKAVEAPSTRPGTEVDGQAKHDEGDDLAEAGQRGVEPLNLPFEGSALVAQDDAGHKDRQEARTVRERGPAIQGQDARKGAQRIETFAGKGDPAHEPQQSASTEETEDCPHTHLEGELACHLKKGPAADRAGSQQADQQGDTHRVVRP
jgi:hypothetical protein